MCLVSVKPKGIELNELFFNGVASGVESNGDGSGFAFKKAGESKIYISKGYLSADEIINAIKSHNLQKDDELIVHSRIGTSGGRNKVNMHPFVVSEKMDDILTTEGYVEYPVLAHNGIFSKFSDYHSEYSDTFHFTRRFMSIPEVQSLLKRDQVTFESIYDHFLGSNKVSILFPDCGLINIGKFVEDQGFLFSNGGYKYGRSYRNVGGVETFTKNKSCSFSPDPKNIYKSENDEDDDRTYKPKLKGWEKLLPPPKDNKVIDVSGLNILLSSEVIDKVYAICYKATSSNSLVMGYVYEITDITSDGFCTIKTIGQATAQENRIVPVQLLYNFCRFYSKKGHATMWADYKYINANLKVGKNTIKTLSNKLKRCRKEKFRLENLGMFLTEAVKMFVIQEKLRQLAIEKEAPWVDDSSEDLALVDSNYDLVD